MLGEDLVHEFAIRDVPLVELAVSDELPASGDQIVQDHRTDAGVEAGRRDGAADVTRAAGDQDFHIALQPRKVRFVIAGPLLSGPLAHYQPDLCATRMAAQTRSRYVTPRRSDPDATFHRSVPPAAGERAAVRPVPGPTGGRAASQSSSAMPIGVVGGACMNGQISSAIARQFAVACISPSRANKPR